MAPATRTVNGFDDPFFCKCHEIKTLGRENDEEARRLLTTAAEHVTPIMAKRKWKVLVLEEFYPDLPNLLGLNHNHGQRVQIRLRSPSKPSTFLPYTSILNTLLHELCHNAVGPHNAQFYALLDEITAESNALPSRDNPLGGAGARLGSGGRGVGGARHELGAGARRRAAANAAAARAARERVFSPPTALGGGSGGEWDGVYKVCDPREMAVAAAMRRAADEKWCGSGGGSGGGGGGSGGAGSVAEVVEVVDDGGDDEVVEVPVQSGGRGSRKRTSDVPFRNSAAARAAARRAAGRV